MHEAIKALLEKYKNAREIKCISHFCNNPQPTGAFVKEIYKYEENKNMNSIDSKLTKQEIQQVTCKCGSEIKIITQ